MSSTAESLSWTINTSNRKHNRFTEEERQWKGPFFFIQGADSQFGFISNELKKDKIITWDEEIALCEKLVKRINEMNPKPRFFVICGDLVDAFPTAGVIRQQQESDFKRIFSKIDPGIPLVCVCGNHDVGNTPTPESVNGYKSSMGEDYFSFWCGGLWFLVINSQFLFDPSQVEKLAKEQSDWLESCLDTAKKNGIKRIIIFQHIPWFLKDIDDPENYFTIKPNIRRYWLDRFLEAGVEAAFCGHYHRNAGGTYKDMEVVVTSAIGGQLGNDVSGARVVKILENKIEHTYYGIDDLPLEQNFQ